MSTYVIWISDFSVQPWQASPGMTGTTSSAFQKGIELRIDRTNVYEETPGEIIALLQLAGGLQLNLTTDGLILLDVEESVREKAAA